MSGLTFESLRDEHASELLSLWSDPVVTRFTNWSPLASLEEISLQVTRLKDRYSDASRRDGPYVLRTGAGEFVGLVGVDFVEGEHELWYLLRHDQWGKGYGSFAVAELMARLQRERKFERIIATAVSQNTASWRLLEKNGFDRVKVMPSAFSRNGASADLFKYERHLVFPA